MIKQIFYKAIAAFFLLSVGACQDDIAVDTGREVPKGYMALDFKVDIPDMKQVSTRSVDFDGGGVQELWLFCFGENGAFISTAKATLNPEGNDSGWNVTEGTFSATISEYTHIIHFVANQNMTDFDESAVGGLSEKALMDRLIASSGKMVYWQRVEAESNTTEAWAKAVGNGVELIRNQARFFVENGESASPQIVAFSVYNTSAFGTVAPYNSEDTDFVWDTDPNGYLSLPKGDEYASRLNSPTDQTAEVMASGSTPRYEYVFETENTKENPVSVILKGTDNKFYRVLVIDENGNFLPIRRNTSYRIHVSGALSNGEQTYADALEASATNNVWISIPDDINAINDGEHELGVEKTFVVYQTLTGSTRNETIKYTYSSKGLDGKYTQDPVSGITPEVTLLTDGNAAKIVGTPTFQGREGSISLEIPWLGDGETKRESVISIKAGHLERTVKIFLVKEFTFTPAWISTSIYGNLEGQPVTMMFTIPDDLPEELFPLDVKIGGDWLNVRQSTGMQLPTITPIGDPDKFGSLDDNWKFKFVYTATEPGVQRVYFNTVLTPETDGEGKYKMEKVTLEADNFAKLTKQFTFSKEQYYIQVADLIRVDGSDLGSEMPDEEPVYYCLVPQKMHAPVNFKIELREGDAGGDNGRLVNAGPDDAFLLYAQHIDHYTDDEWTAAGNDIDILECNFKPVDNTLWETGGRVFSFTPRNLKTERDTYNIYLRTNQPASAEVVRISSNQPGGDDNYMGRTYRSITFELANYNPFKFSASVKDGNQKMQSWDYGPGQSVNVEFDVTSFRGSDNKSADPFGEDFDVYIDAPMLEIDENNRGNYTEDIFYEDAGRFILKIKKNREDNRIGTGDVAVKDEPLSDSDYDPVPETIDQTGEHHVLPFKTKGIVNEGEITISADKNIVVFDEERFVITNNTIDGTIKFGNRGQGWEDLQNVPAGAFVTFEIANNGTRIGSMSITSDGNYSLTLRKEYKYVWDATQIELHYTVGEDVYHGTVNTLQDLYSNETSRSIALYKEEVPAS